MKLINAIKKEQGLPFKIPYSSREDLPEFFEQMGYKVGVEIGTHKGEFTEKLCKAKLKIYTIDPWMGFGGQGRTQKVQYVQDGYYEEAKKVLIPYGNCTIIRKTSMDALEDFRDGGLDFVYMDGNHDFSHIASDIYEWSKKVRVGGVVSGHDYFNTSPTSSNVICHVKSVVDAYMEMFEIENFYLCGGNKTDKYYSYLYVK